MTIHSLVLAHWTAPELGLVAGIFALGVAAGAWLAARALRRGARER